LPSERDAIFEVWPENLEIISMFFRVSTQWRTSMAGATGLDYGVLFQLFDLYAIKNRREVFEGIQAMEGAILRLMNEDK
jgi:hypothetical protein